MQLNTKRTIIVLVYWGVLSFLSGWIAHDSTPIEILELMILYVWGFITSVYGFKTKSLKTEESKKE